MTITYEDFKKLDLRVATISSIEKIPGKTRILKGQIDLGDETRDVIVGGADFFEPEELLNKTVIVVANLEPKKIASIESNCMLLAADVDGKEVRKISDILIHLHEEKSVGDEMILGIIRASEQMDIILTLVVRPDL